MAWEAAIDAESTLASNCLIGASSLTVATGEGARFPTGRHAIRVDDEIMTIASRSGDVFTIDDRAIESVAGDGGVEADHFTSAAVRHVITPGQIKGMIRRELPAAWDYINRARCWEEQTAGTNSTNNSNSGAWRTTVLNNAGGIASVTSNVITLDHLGFFYIVRARCPIFATNRFQLRLRDVTNNLTLLSGIPTYAFQTGVSSGGMAEMFGEVYIDVGVDLELQHRVEQSGGNVGLAANFGETEIYAYIDFWQVNIT